MAATRKSLPSPSRRWPRRCEAPRTTLTGRSHRGRRVDQPEVEELVVAYLADVLGRLLQNPGHLRWAQSRVHRLDQCEDAAGKRSRAARAGGLYIPGVLRRAVETAPARSDGRRSSGGVAGAGWRDGPRHARAARAAQESGWQAHAGDRAAARGKIPAWRGDAMEARAVVAVIREAVFAGRARLPFRGCGRK